MSPPLRSRAISALPAHGPLQLHLLDRRCAYTCTRCAWTSQARTVGVQHGDWDRIVCRSCYNTLMNLAQQAKPDSP